MLPLLYYECLIDDVELKNAMIEANSVAIDWKPLYSVEQCACLTPFTYSTKKVPTFINNNKVDNTLEPEPKTKAWAYVALIGIRNDNYAIE